MPELSSPGRLQGRMRLAGAAMTDKPVVFRGLANRTLADQEDAILKGYSNMHVYAIDELALIVLEMREELKGLTERLDRLEADTQGMIDP